MRCGSRVRRGSEERSDMCNGKAGVVEPSLWLTCERDASLLYVRPTRRRRAEQADGRARSKGCSACTARGHGGQIFRVIDTPVAGVGHHAAQLGVGLSRLGRQGYQRRLAGCQDGANCRLCGKGLCRCLNCRGHPVVLVGQRRGLDLDEVGVVRCGQARHL